MKYLCVLSENVNICISDSGSHVSRLKVHVIMLLLIVLMYVSLWFHPVCVLPVQQHLMLPGDLLAKQLLSCRRCQRQITAYIGPLLLKSLSTNQRRKAELNWDITTKNIINDSPVGRQFDEKNPIIYCAAPTEELAASLCQHPGQTRDVMISFHFAIDGSVLNYYLYHITIFFVFVYLKKNMLLTLIS